MTIEVLVRDDNGNLLVRELKATSPDYPSGTIFYKLKVPQIIGEYVLTGISFSYWVQYTEKRLFNNEEEE